MKNCIAGMLLVCSLVFPTITLAQVSQTSDMEPWHNGGPYAPLEEGVGSNVPGVIIEDPNDGTHDIFCYYANTPKRCGSKESNEPVCCRKCTIQNPSGGEWSRRNILRNCIQMIGEPEKCPVSAPTEHPDAYCRWYSEDKDGDEIPDVCHVECTELVSGVPISGRLCGVTVPINETGNPCLWES